MRWQFYSPKLFVRVAGEQKGEPIILSDKGEVVFAVGTNSDSKSFISEVWVNFEPDEVDLTDTRGAEERITLENRFPKAMLFSDRKLVAKKHLQANYVDYQSKSGEFYLKFTVITEVDESAIPFSFHISSAPKEMVYKRIIKFKPLVFDTKPDFCYPIFYQYE